MYPKSWKGRKMVCPQQLKQNSEWLKQREKAKCYGEISKERNGGRKWKML